VTTDARTLLDPARVAASQAKIARVVDELRRVILGKEQVIDEVVTALLARGHVLLEGLPGLGKTELVKALSRLLSLDVRRIQFTPDLLPTDVTGSHILQEAEGKKAFVFHAGPIFTNLLLADEINRASPKTQSALLEAMQERRVTTFGETRPLPSPFFVLATQNPIELEGTYPLPEAQLDRFMFKVEIAGVDRAVLEEILTTRVHGQVPLLEPVLTAGELADLFAVVDQVHLPRGVANYISRIVAATHPGSSDAPEAVKAFVKYGSSPRAAIAIGDASRAFALLQGKPNVGFDDVRRVTAPSIAHRLVLDYAARLEGWDGRRVVGALLEAIPEIERGLPRTLETR
jgi:MoxR-like ATPase